MMSGRIEKMRLFICLLALAFGVCHGEPPSFIPLLDDKVWWLQHRPDGIFEGDFFGIFSSSCYEYISLYLNGRKCKPLTRDDSEDEYHVKRFMHHQGQDEVFLNAYAVPVLQPGTHRLSITLSKDKFSGIAIIDVLLRCRHVPLLFFHGQTSQCALDLTTKQVRTYD